MKPEAAEEIITGMKEAGINFVSSVPSSSFTTLWYAIIEDPHFTHVEAGNESDAVSICAGAFLGGKKPAFVAENAGLVLATYALTGGRYFFGGFPIVLIVDHRGDFGENAGRHFYGWSHMSPVILNGLEIPYIIVNERNKFADAIVRSLKTAETFESPAAVLLCGEDVHAK